VKPLRVVIPTVRAIEDQLAAEQLDAANIPFILDTGPEPIPEKRQRILWEAGNEPVVMVDDDMLFYKVSHDGHAARADDADLRNLFQRQLPSLLLSFAHGGIQQRLFANVRTARGYPYIRTAAHYRQVLCYNPSLFKRPVQFTGPTGEDLWMLAQLAQQGLDWFLVTSFAITEKEPRGEPERWTFEQKKRDLAAHCAKLDEKYHRKITAKNKNAGTTINFRKLALENGAKG
jgi:hypothetical protein